jgi:hypothetical protein
MTPGETSPEMIDAYSTPLIFTSLPPSSFSSSSSAYTNLFVISIVCDSTPSNERERPKSAICTEQSSFINTFAGFKSLWRMFAECKYLSPQSKLYTTVEICLFSKYIADLITFFKSLSDRLSTM